MKPVVSCWLVCFCLMHVISCIWFLLLCHFVFLLSFFLLNYWLLLSSIHSRIRWLRWWKRVITLPVSFSWRESGVRYLYEWGEMLDGGLSDVQVNLHQNEKRMREAKENAVGIRYAHFRELMLLFLVSNCHPKRLSFLLSPRINSTCNRDDNDAGMSFVFSHLPASTLIS